MGQNPSVEKPYTKARIHDRRGGARLPGARRARRRGGQDRRAASCWSSPTASSIDRYAARCRKAGIQLVGIDLEAFALLRALPTRSRRTGPRHRRPRSSPSRSATTARPSPSPTAGPASSRACSSGAAARSTSPSPGRSTWLRPRPSRSSAQLGLVDDETPEGLSDEKAAAAGRQSRGELQSFARELVSSLQFYQNQPGSLGIAEIVVTGGTAHLAGTRRAAPEAHRRPRSRRRSARARPRRQAAQGRRADRLADCRDRPGGRALMRAVNLLPRDDRPSRASRASRSCSSEWSAARAARRARRRLHDDEQRAFGECRPSSPNKQAEFAVDARPDEAPAVPQESASSPASGRRAWPPSPPRSPSASRGIGSCAASRSCCPTTSGFRPCTDRPAPPTPRSGSRPGPVAPATGFSVTGRTYSHDGVARLLATAHGAAGSRERPAPDEPLVKLRAPALVEFTIVAGVRTRRRPRETSRILARVQIALVVLGLLVVAALGYFPGARPQRPPPPSCQAQIKTLHRRPRSFACRRRTASTADAEPIRVAELFRLSKAMPERVDMPGGDHRAQRDRTRHRHRVRVDHPLAATAADGYQVRQPINLVFEGNYYELSDFLFRSAPRRRARRRADATGRLFIVQSRHVRRGRGVVPADQGHLDRLRLRLRQRRPRRYAVGRAAPATSPAAGVPSAARARRRRRLRRPRRERS